MTDFIHVGVFEVLVSRSLGASTVRRATVTALVCTLVTSPEKILRIAMPGDLFVENIVGLLNFFFYLVYFCVRMGTRLHLLRGEEYSRKRKGIMCFGITAIIAYAIAVVSFALSLTAVPSAGECVALVAQVLIFFLTFSFYWAAAYDSQYWRYLSFEIMGLPVNNSSLRSSCVAGEEAIAGAEPESPLLGHSNGNSSTSNGFGGADSISASLRMSEIVQPLLQSRAAKCVVDFTKIQVQGLLGRGAFGEVHVAQFRGQVVAVKTMLCDEITPRLIRDFVHEATLLSSLEHKHIIRFMGISFSPPHMCLITEYCLGGPLKSWIDTYHPRNCGCTDCAEANGGDRGEGLWKSLLSKNVAHTRTSDETKMHALCLHQTRFSYYRNAIMFALGAAKGLEYLHQRVPSLVHGDVKSTNVLIDEKGLARLCDFGEACSRANRRSSAGGTAAWMSPEVAQAVCNKKLSVVPHPSRDVYAFGVLLWELLCGKSPYEDVKFNTQLLQGIISGHTLPLQPPDFPAADLPAGLPALLRDTWHPDPSSRPGMSAVVARLQDVVAEIDRVGFGASGHGVT